MPKYRYNLTIQLESDRKLTDKTFDKNFDVYDKNKELIKGKFISLKEDTTLYTFAQIIAEIQKNNMYGQPYIKIRRKNWSSPEYHLVVYSDFKIERVNSAGKVVKFESTDVSAEDWYFV